MSEQSEVSGTRRDPRTARGDGRALDELRPVSFERDYTVMAPGSVLVSFGRTKVLCTASVEDRVPPWMRGSGKGWVTAEYSMLPGSTPERASREAAKGKQSGRTQEIQRLIARSLRAVCDLVVLGEVQVTVDCDVLQADGGTRTASICGAYVALHDAFSRLQQAGTLRENPLTDSVAAISVGIIDGVPMLDLPYAEDSRAEVDMNVVMTGAGRFVEVQGTAEGMAFSRGELDSLLGLAEVGHQGALGARRRPCWPSRRRRGERRRAAAARAGLGQSGQGGGDRRRAGRRARRRAAFPARPRCPTSSRTGRPCSTTPASRRGRWWRPPGWPPWPTTRGWRSTRSGGAPGVYSARYAGEDVTYADNVAKLLDGARRPARRRRARARPVSAPSPWWRSPTAPSCGPRAWSTGRSPAGPGERRLRLRPGLRAGRGRRAHVRRDDPGGEARHLASWTGVPRPGGRAGRPPATEVSDRRSSSVAGAAQAQRGHARRRLAAARAARIIFTPLVSESLISRSLSLEMKSCTRFSSRNRMMGLKAW